MTPKEVVKKSYEAFAAGDLPTLASLCAEDMAVKMGGEMPISGEYNGFEAWATGQLAKMQALWPNFKLEFVNMFEDDGNVFTILKTDDCVSESFEDSGIAERLTALPENLDNR